MNLKSCFVGSVVLGSLAGCSDSSDKSVAQTEITSPSTTTTTTIPVPPTTVYGTPDSYELSASWPTEPDLARVSRHSQEGPTRSTGASDALDV
ncbi:MAG: hypothetical protein ACSLFB_09340 [Acidimicrobiales bacterium]